MPKKISFLSLLILIIAAIDNVRNLPAAALSGSSLIFFFTIAALIFLIPTALVSAELSAAFPQHGGVYQWVRLAFGKRWGMAAIWMQWINTLVWYPTILSFIVVTSAYVIDPDLGENRAFLVIGMLVLFWGVTLVNMRGLNVSALLNNIFCVMGTMIPLAVLIVLGMVWVFSGQPLQVDMNPSTMVPSFSDGDSWTTLVVIMASFLGIELSGVHVHDIINPQRNFPRALLLAAVFIFLTMVLGSLSIAFVLPGEDISIIAGVMQVYSNFFKHFDLEWLTPILTLLIVIGSTGTMINWIISPAKGLSHAAEYGFLPPLFVKLNKNGVASNILLAQAVLVSVFSLLFLVESINGFYWFLTALSTELYMSMYVLMFLAALRLHYTHADRDGCFKIPGGAIGLWAIAFLGLIGCLSTIGVSFLPPPHVDVGTPWRYFLMICTGNVVTIVPLFLIYAYESKKRSLEAIT
jgi:amino acid transporter